MAKAFGAAGASVVVNYSTSAAGADRVVTEIVGSGGKAIAVQGDVSKAADAGVFRFEPLEAVTEAEFHREFNTNVPGTILTIQEALKYFGEAGGNAINVSSIASKNPTPDSVVYAATKSAVDSITLGLSRELGARKIRVNAIAPGGVETEGLATVGILGGEFEKQVIDMTPLGRFGQPEDIARVAVFLASEDAAWLTGERITASGGWR